MRETVLAAIVATLVMAAGIRAQTPPTAPTAPAAPTVKPPTAATPPTAAQGPTVKPPVAATPPTVKPPTAAQGPTVKPPTAVTPPTAATLPPAVARPTAAHADAATPPTADAPRAAPTPSVTARANPLVEEALRYDPVDPLGNLEAADVLDRGARGGPRKVVVPPHGCVVSDEPRRIWSTPGIASLAAFGSGFVLAGYTKSATGGEQVFVVHVTAAGKLEPVATLPIDAPQAFERKVAPGLAADAAQGVTVAYTDGAGNLMTQALRVGAAHGGGSARVLARGVDTRYVPAVSYGRQGPLIAYTLGTSPMRSMLVRIDPKGDVASTHDVTPAAMGAAAPAFSSVSGPAWLVTADPRNGMSPIARTPLDRDGKPGTAEVAAPVGMMSQPPALVAAQAELGGYLLYTGLGSAATSAVGLMKFAPSAGAPEAFVKGIAYGPLHAAAVATKTVVLLAADAPLAAGKQPKHAVQVVLLDAKGQGPALQVTTPGGDATHVAIAHSEAAGVGLSFSATDGVYLGKLRCGGI